MRPCVSPSADKQISFLRCEFLLLTRFTVVVRWSYAALGRTRRAISSGSTEATVGPSSERARRFFFAPVTSVPSARRRATPLPTRQPILRRRRVPTPSATGT